MASLARWRWPNKIKRDLEYCDSSSWTEGVSSWTTPLNPNQYSVFPTNAYNFIYVTYQYYFSANLVHSKFTNIQLVITNDTHEEKTTTTLDTTEMNETFPPAIKYERPFDPDKLKEYMWKQSQDNEFTNARAPCFTGTSVEELFYCEDHFRDAMAQLEKPEGVWFAQWRS